MSVDDATPGTDLRAAVGVRLRWLREGPRSELVTGVAFLLGVGLGSVHWLGLVAGGALVGFLAPSLRRALVLGAYLGGVVALGFVAWLFVFGAFGRAVATEPLFGLSMALSLVCPVLGAGIRGLG